MKMTLAITLLLGSLNASAQPLPKPDSLFPTADVKSFALSTAAGVISIWDTGGNGRPVLFIHGNSCCKEMFLKQFNSPLAKKYRLIAIDLPGHGHSTKALDPEKTYTFDGYADLVKELTLKLQLKNPAIVGWSLGGHVALNALAKGQKFSGVLITGTPPIEISYKGFHEGFNPIPEFLPLISKVEFTRDDAIAFLNIGNLDIDIDKYPFALEGVLRTDGIARKTLADSIANNSCANQRTLVETNNTPLCIIQGRDDSGINVKYLESISYKNRFQNKIFLIENAGHAVFWSQPQEFNQILDEFLESLN